MKDRFWFYQGVELILLLVVLAQTGRPTLLQGLALLGYGLISWAEGYDEAHRRERR